MAIDAGDRISQSVAAMEEVLSAGLYVMMLGVGRMEGEEWPQ
jgi:hypothetical protein